MTPEVDPDQDPTISAATTGGRRQDTRTEGPALDPRRVFLVGAGLITVFGALALWGMLGVSDGAPEAPIPPAAIGPSSSDPDDASSTGKNAGSPTPAPELEPIVQGRLLKNSRVLPGLLTRRFQRSRPDGRPLFTSLRTLLPVRGVTVINVWASYCEPCKREFPGFRKLQSDWGNSVRFVPIQIDDGEAPAIMPEAPDHLVDYTPGGAVQAELANLGELPINAPIPITLLLDCRQELRWVQQGEVKDMQAFDHAVQTLRAELRTPRCAIKAQPVEPPPTVPADACKRLKCKANQTCEQRKLDGTYFCLDDLG
jgi:thiol-disulfide isomerase/thioredoxin